MKTAIFLLLILLAACGPHMTLLIHPKTGEVVRCSAGVNQYGAPIGQEERINCVQQHELIGFIQAEKLTPEQRANLVPKTKPVVIEMERGR